MRRYINLALVLILCLSLLSITALAAGESASLTGPGSVRAGDTVTVTLNVSGNGIYGASGALSYNSSQLSLVSAQTVIGGAWMVEFNGNNFVAYDNNLSSPIQGTAAVFSLTFKVGDVEPGASIAVSCNNLVVSDGAADTQLGTVSYYAVAETPKSSDNSLSSLTVGNASITPAFDPNVTAYSASVPFSTQQLNVSVVPAAKATVSVNSPTLTPGGITKVTITVTAENGQTKVYTISTYRDQDPNYVESSNNNLSSIRVDGFLLSPEFDTKVTEYVVWLPYETESVSVTATSADYKASIRVEGGEDLVAGADNEIKVICTAEDGTEKVYTVIAKRAAAHGSAETTEPETTVPETEPETEPTVPAPTEPQVPSDGGNDGGSPWWILLIIAIVCLACGAAIGILVSKKHPAGK
ncbi:MAG: cadherin-like beta sandwich domain-containing protein [Oscillospiraceae bacterium]|nr:cadherin-like beta sandwich domain-containing protein [Oscillospiraceae bacterium]